jgi:hypothetical protein
MVGGRLSNTILLCKRPHELSISTSRPQRLGISTGTMGGTPMKRKRPPHRLGRPLIRCAQSLIISSTREDGRPLAHATCNGVFLCFSSPLFSFSFLRRRISDRSAFDRARLTAPPSIKITALHTLAPSRSRGSCTLLSERWILTCQSQSRSQFFSQNALIYKCFARVPPRRRVSLSGQQIN